MKPVTALCLAALCLVAVGIVVRLVLSGPKERLAFLKNFKKGKFLLVYLIAVPLYWVGIAEGGETVWRAFLQAVRAAVELVVLKFNYSGIEAAYLSDGFYRGTVDFCSVLVLLNAAVFTFTLVGQRLINGWRGFVASNLRKTTYVLVGWNERQKMILRSVGKRSALVFGKLSPAEQEEIFLCGQAWYGEREFSKKVLRLASGADRRLVVFFVQTETEEETLKRTAALCEVLERKSLVRLGAEQDRGFRIYAFGAPQNRSAFEAYVERSRGCIQAVDKYRKIAEDYVVRFPLTEDLPDCALDRSAACLSSEAELFTVFIGFGKTARQLFLSSVSCFQFSDREGKARPVSYHILDCDAAENEKNLNHNLFRFSQTEDWKREGERYFPMPEKPAEVEFLQTDINDRRFYEEIRSRIGSALHRFGRVVIAFGTDLENFDLAEKLRAKLREWDAERRVRLFVKIRDAGIARLVREAAAGGYEVIGVEKEEVYSADAICSETVEAMARLRNFCYIAEQNRGEKEARIREIAREKWYGEWKQVQRDANVSATLALRFKLQLMGFDLVPEGDPRPDGTQDFLRVYECGNPIVRTGETLFGRPVIDYDATALPEESLRGRLARQEHLRWNAFYLANGFVPASVPESLSCRKSELFDRRKHPNLTTFDGLREYAKAVAERDGVPASERDVLRYDCQILDDAPWIVATFGWKIVRRERTNPPEGGEQR